MEFVCLFIGTLGHSSIIVCAVAEDSILWCAGINTIK
jgi:hypothetical protein